MPCQGCVGWMGQQTGTYTKYWCPADGTFHFDWEPCGQAPAPPPAAPAPPTGGGTPGMALTPVSPPTTSLMAPIGGVSKGCKCCGPSASGAGAVAPMALSVATAVTPCPCANGGTRKALPWWAWVLGALGAVSVLRRVVRG